MNKLALFKALHHQPKPLILVNAWDVLSAKILEQKGLKAIATTSWGLANAHGYSDGEHLPFSLLLRSAKEIVNGVNIPVSIDMEAGYGNTPGQIVENVLAIAAAGVAGINIEDSIKNANGLKTIEEQAALISILKTALTNVGKKNFFINARIDTYFKKPADYKQQTLLRASAYEKAGASGVFVPGMKTTSDIKQLLNAVSIPVNVMALPGLTDLSALENIGVKRISIGKGLSDAVVAYIEEVTDKILQSGNTTVLYGHKPVATKFTAVERAVELQPR